MQQGLWIIEKESSPFLFLLIDASDMVCGSAYVLDIGNLETLTPGTVHILWFSIKLLSHIFPSIQPSINIVGNSTLGTSSYCVSDLVCLELYHFVCYGSICLHFILSYLNKSNLPLNLHIFSQTTTVVEEQTPSSQSWMCKAPMNLHLF